MTRFKKNQNSLQLENGKFPGINNILGLTYMDHACIVLRYLYENNSQTPIAKLPLKQVDLKNFQSNLTNQLNTTWLGHSSLMININGYKVLTDPVLENRMSPLGPFRFNGDIPLDIDQLPPIDIVIISHDHHDHLNKYSIQYLKKITKKFIVPRAVGSKLLSWGVSDDKIVELNWWEKYQVSETFTITATPAQHFSGRRVGGRNLTLWASWVLKSPEYSLFFSGDSGYFEGFKKIGKAFGPFDMTFLECGAYDKLWHPVHMFPEETVQAHLDLKGKVLHPIHWGTFNLSFHPWYEPMQRLLKAVQLANIDIATPVVGETIIYNYSAPSLPWWKPAMRKENGYKVQKSIALVIQ